MILWLNGLFGVGKTTTAERVAAQLDSTALVDPEEIGFSLPQWTGNGGPVADFQNIPLWRSLTRESVAATDDACGTVIVSMTLLNEAYFDEVIVGLRGDGHQVRHFTLTASPSTILARGASREDGLVDWAVMQNERYRPALTNDTFEEFIDTEDLSVDQVAAQILRRATG